MASDVFGSARTGLALAVGLLASPAGAQVRSNAVEIDDHVRISTVEFPRDRDFRFAGRRGDTLFFRLEGTTQVDGIADREVRRFKVLIGQRSRGMGALVGMRNGILIGFGIGALAGAFGETCTACEDPFTRPQLMILGGIGGAIIGAPIGLVGGIASPGVAWRRISPHDALRFALVPDATPPGPTPQ